jgi:hypothetical protein
MEIRHYRIKKIIGADVLFGRKNKLAERMDSRLDEIEVSIERIDRVLNLMALILDDDAQKKFTNKMFSKRLKLDRERKKRKDHQSYVR